MKKLLIIAVLFCIVCSCYAQTTIITQTSLTLSEMYDKEIYHESDDICFRSPDYVIYLNQTSPVSDTIYVYHIVKPKTTQMHQCKFHHLSTECNSLTPHPSGYCRAHRPAIMPMYVTTKVKTP